MTDRYTTRIRTSALGRPIRVKDESQCKSLRDNRKVKLVGSRKRPSENLSRIYPLMSEYIKGHGRCRRLVMKLAMEGKQIDNSKAAINRAAESFAAEQALRRKNHFRGKRGFKRIPMTDETLKKMKDDIKKGLV